MPQSGTVEEQRGDAIKRWRQALSRVARVERRAPTLEQYESQHRWHIHGRTAVGENALSMTIPKAIRPRRPTTHVLGGKAAADVITIGKFDVDREVRLRAFYLEPGLSLRLQSGGTRNGIDRSLAAYAEVRKHAPDLMPTIVENGRLGRARYLLEDSIFGWHPRDGKTLQTVAYDVAASLRPLHQGVGVWERPLSEVVSAKFKQRWRYAVTHIGIESDLDQAVRRLIARDGLVDISMGHGDLVGTNIVKLDDAVVLIDWEYAGLMPIAFDFAKIQIYCPDPRVALEEIERGLGGEVGTARGHYSLSEQIALAHARYLSWIGHTRRRAQAAGRMRQFDDNVALRTEAIKNLLSV